MGAPPRPASLSCSRCSPRWPSTVRASPNPYGHPHPSTLANLARVGAQIYGTDVNGTVLGVADAQSYHILTQKGNGPRAPPGNATAVPGRTEPTRPGATATASAPPTGGSLGGRGSDCNPPP